MGNAQFCLGNRVFGVSLMGQNGLSNLSTADGEVLEIGLEFNQRQVEGLPETIDCRC